MTRRIAWGGALGALFLAVAAAYGALGLPVLPLYDGIQPPSPYRWVVPPPEFADENQPALPGEQEVPVEDVTVGFGAATEDAQAQLIVATDVVAEPPPDARALLVTLTPLDPTTLGPPPAGLLFSGNAYEVEAVYRPGGEPVTFTGGATVVERYATRARTLLRWTGSAWERVPGTQIVAGSLQAFAEVTELGIFVAAGPPQHTGGGGTPIWLWVAAGAGGGLLALGVSWFLRRRRPATRAGRKGAAKAGSKKGKSAKKGKR